MKSILFDLDGTLANTLPLCIQAFREALGPLAGREFSDEEIVATFGPTEEGTVAELLPGNEAEGLKRYLERYRILHCHWPRPFEGMLDILQYLKEKRAFVGMITAKGEHSTDFTLQQYGLSNYFDVVKTGAATGPIKDVRIEEVIREYALPREDMLYVGDSPLDITASRDCRIKVAAAAWAPTANEQLLRSMAPDFLFTSVDDFFHFLKQEFDREVMKE